MMQNAKTRVWAVFKEILLSIVAARCPSTGAVFTRAPCYASKSASTIVSVSVVRTTAIMVVPSPFAMIAPMTTAVVDNRRWTIVARRFVHHGGRRAPTKWVDVDVYVGVCGRACHHCKCDDTKRLRSNVHKIFPHWVNAPVAATSFDYCFATLLPA